MTGKRDAENVEGGNKQIRILNDYLANIPEKNCLEESPMDDFWKISVVTYLLRPWLMTPVLNTVTRQQQSYNASHMSTRNIEHFSTAQEDVVILYLQL